MASDIITHTDKLNVPFEGIKTCLPTFPTKRAAVEAGAAFGCRKAVRLDSRWERVWVVGSMDIHTDEIAGVPRDVFRLSMLRWERGADQIQRCPVLKVYRVKAAH